MTQIETDPFATARDGVDLVAGNQRAVTAVSDALAGEADQLSEVRSSLDRMFSAARWSGSAAEAFHAHTAGLIDTVDHWSTAVGYVLNVLGQHGAHLDAAQDTADEALELWRKAQKQVANVSTWDSPTWALASNAEEVRDQVQAAIGRATDRAHRILGQAQNELAEQGNSASVVVRKAAAALQSAALPTLALPSSNDRSEPATGGPVVIVQPHDTLSAIAERELGDPNRWPEIYRLNVGHAVAPHHVLVNPNHIEPGWSLQVPAGAGPHLPPGTTTPPAPLNAVPPAPVGHGSALAPPPPVLAPPAPPSTGSTAAVSAAHPAVEHGFDLGDGLVLAGGAALAVAGVAAAVGIRRRYSTGRLLPADDQDEPGIYQLAEDLTALDETSQSRPESNPWGGSMPLAHRNGRAVLVDTAATIGLGLAGAGASAAARALLVSILATDDAAEAWMTSAVRDQLLGPRGTSPRSRPTQQAAPSTASSGGRVVVHDDLDEVLDRAEPELVTRTRQLENSGGSARPRRLVLVVDAPDDSRRLRAVAENGLGLGITVIVLGFWRPGITCHVATDGRIQNVTGDQAGRWALAGLTTFTAGQDDAHTLIGLLGHVEPAVPAPRLEPTPPEPPAALVPEPASSPTMDQQHDDEGEQHDRIVRLLSPAADEIEEPKKAEVGADTPLTFRVLGEVSLEWVTPDQRRDITGRFMPKFQEVLVYLALHPQGVRRDRLSATIWPNSGTGGRPFNSFHSALSQIRALALRATNGQVDNLIEREGDRYRLNSDVVATDYGRFQHLIAAHRGPAVRQADVQTVSEAVALYRGELASNLKAAWLEGHREGVRRDVLTRLKALIQELNVVDPAEALDVSHEVCRIDPYNEENYRNVMRLQARVGQYQAITRTLALLSSKLVDIDERPNDETTRLAASLQRPSERRTTG